MSNGRHSPQKRQDRDDDSHVSPNRQVFEDRHQLALTHIRGGSYFYISHDYIRYLGIGFEAAAVLCDIINTGSIRNYADQDWWFDYTVAWMEKRTTLKRQAQQRVLKKLRDAGLIRVRQDGYPGRRQVRVNMVRIENTVADGIEKDGR